MAETGKIAEALTGFQAEMPVIAKAHTAKVKTKTGADFSYTYAGLADVTAAAAPLLSKHGLAFVTAPRRAEYGLELVGHLLHVSGERLEGALPIGGNSPQEIGSAITYARRYLLGAMTGLVTDDDDDGQLAQSATKKRAAKRPASAEQPMPSDVGINEAQMKRMHAMFNERGITDRARRLAGISQVVGREITSSKELTKAEAKKVMDSLTAHAEQPPAEATEQGQVDAATGELVDGEIVVQPEVWETS